jgi:LCP family protein required for cell wall assembly
MFKKQEKEKKPKQPKAARPKPTLLMKIIGGVLIVLAVGAAIYTFTFVREIISSTDIFQVGGLSIQPGAESDDPEAPGGLTEPDDQPATGAINVTQIDIDFTERINVLIMGLDYRDWEADAGPARSDTMMLLTLDPIAKTASMLSIPRDLWVNIPGYGQYKINTAHYLGEANRLPGGGPELAARTVEEFLGIDIQYWAVIDFTAFVQFVDYIGGVKVEIKEPMRLELIGTQKKEHLKPGIVTLDGFRALSYVRHRKTGDGDFSRAQRQQEVVLAILGQLQRRDVQRMIFANPKGVWDIFSENIHTNVPFDHAFNMGKLALQINRDQIRSYIIAPPDHVTHEYSPDGLTILKPITQNIRLLRDEIFTPAGMTSAEASGIDPNTLMTTEAARVGVYNGSSTSGLAATTEAYLLTHNLTIAEVGNGEWVPSTSIYDFTGNPYTVKYLVRLMGIQDTRIFSSYDPASPIDVAVILGDDWQVPTQ